MWLRIARSSGSTRVVPRIGVVDVVLVDRRQVAVARVPGLLVGGVEGDELQLGAGQGGPAVLGAAVELALQHRARRLHDGGVASRRATPGRTGPSPWPAGGSAAGGCARRGRTPCRRSRAPTRRWRSPRRCSCRRRRRAGSCSPRCRGPRRGRRSSCPCSRLPCRRPCMSVKATTTVSISPARMRADQVVHAQVPLVAQGHRRSSRVGR